MCGIAGIVGCRQPIEGLESTLDGLVRDLHHRGPDDNGVWIAPDRHAGLCSTRLAILDLSPAGHQPMSSSDGRYTIAFNGEIYNFRELRGELVESGIQFRSQSDTEVVLQLYVGLGEACVSRLRGMFAFAVWDTKENSCFLARDPLGIKPLYYYADEIRDELLFGSELKPLLRTNRIPKNLSPLGLFGFLRSGSVQEPLTLVEGVRCLEAGTTMIWRGGSLERKQYWEVRFKTGDETSFPEEKAVETTRVTLLDSVAHHFVSDVPVGIFLSGGIDSTGLVALARVLGHTGELRTFSIGTDDKAGDEAGVARRTAEHFETHHTELELNAERAKEIFNEFLRAIDQPTVDGFNTFAVSKLAHEANMKVILSGLGADEVFGGYPSFNRLGSMMSRKRLLDRVPAGKSVARLVGTGVSDTRWQRLAEFMAGDGDLVSAYRSLRGIFTADQANLLVSHYCGSNGDLADSMLTAPDVPANSNPADMISRLEIEIYMRNQLLRDSDVMSMANELELRVPFVDRRMIETLSEIPARIRIQDRKGLLLKAIPEIPEWVSEPPKRGFLLPFQRWKAREWFPDRQNVKPVVMRSWYQNWTISILDTWLQQIG